MMFKIQQIIVVMTHKVIDLILCVNCSSRMVILMYNVCWLVLSWGMRGFEFQSCFSLHFLIRGEYGCWIYCIIIDWVVWMGV